MFALVVAKQTTSWCVSMQTHTRGHTETKGRAPDNHERSSDQRLYRPRQRGAKGLEGVDRVGVEV